MADRAIHDLDHHVPGAGGASGDRVGGKGAGVVEGGPGLGLRFGQSRGVLCGDAASKRAGGQRSGGQSGTGFQEGPAVFTVAGQEFDLVVARVAHGFLV